MFGSVEMAASSEHAVASACLWNLLSHLSHQAGVLDVEIDFNISSICNYWILSLCFFLLSFINYTVFTYPYRLREDTGFHNLGYA